MKGLVLVPLRRQHLQQDTAPRDPIEVRRAVKTDFDAIQRFICETYGSSAPFKHAARWRWQFEDNPFRPLGESGPSVWIAAVGGRIVGQIAVQDAAAHVGGRRIAASWVVDVMVRPEYRGQGLGHRIHRCVMMERTALFTLTMAPATRRIAERAGCVTLGPVGHYFRMHRLSAITVRRYMLHKAHERPDIYRPLHLILRSAIACGIVATVARCISKLSRLPHRRSSQHEYFEIEEISRFPEEIDEFWNRIRGRIAATFERSMRSLNWRFVDCPDLSYRRFLLRAQGRIRGYLVLRKGLPAEAPAGIIVDIMTDPLDIEAFKVLIDHAELIFEHGVEYIEVAASTCGQAKALRGRGFILLRTKRPTAVCQDPSFRADVSMQANNWYFTKGDHDWDQVHPLPQVNDHPASSAHP